MNERYEPRHCYGENIPTDCCEFAVVDLEVGKEICRVWTADNARRIARLLNAENGRKQDVLGCLRRGDTPSRPHPMKET